MFIGNKEGVDIWYKLGTSEDSLTQAYFNSIRNATQKFGSAYFSDIIEQRKKVLNNQKLFFVFFNKEQQKWQIDLFHVPTP